MKIGSILLLFFAISSQSVFANSNLYQISNVSPVVDNMTRITYIEGDFENTSPKTLQNIFVKINLYKNDKLVGNTLDHASNLPANTIWRFKAAAPMGVDRYQIIDVTLY
ncbi:FxLYD domain-containing protein [Vibrio maritimus]|uniref:FxLYD domain-containing protein n=1 Tax=Vibrio maritimus TaxID=990268 RepID=UPI001F25C0AE|nr:FxLYD domain-containing protein [Vibrio maritimus]